MNKVHKGESSLRWFGPIVWDNMLPEEYKNIGTLEKFRDEVHKWIPEKCPCRLCKTYVRGLGFINVTG